MRSSYQRRSLGEVQATPDKQTYRANAWGFATLNYWSGPGYGRYLNRYGDGVGCES